MFKLSDLKAAHNTKVERVKQLASKLETDGQLNADDEKEFAQLQTEITELKGKISNLEYAQGLAIAEATDVTAPTGQGVPAIHTKREPKQYPGAKMARVGLSLLTANGDRKEAAHFASTELNDKEVSMAFDSAADSGGALIPEAYSREFIDLLRPKLTIANAGARVITMPKGKMTLTRQSGGATSSFRAENQPVNATSPQTEPVKLNAKSQMTIVPLSNELKGRSDHDAELMVLEDMLNAHAECQDMAFLRGDGSGNMPKGLATLAADHGRVVPYAAADVDPATVDRYLDSLILKHKNSKSKMRKCGWIMCPRTWMWLYGLRDANGNKYYPEMEKGMLKRYPVQDTTQVPDNLGVSSDLSEIYFNDFDDVVIGYDPVFDLSVSTEATYYDANGNLQSAFANNQTVVRLVGASDINCRHPEGIVQGTAVKF